MDEVGRVEQKVEVFHGLGQEERLHAVVQLVVSQIFDLPRGRGKRVRTAAGDSRRGRGAISDFRLAMEQLSTNPVGWNPNV